MISLGQKNIPENKLYLILDSKTQETREVYVNLKLGDKVLNDLNAGEYQVVVEDSNKNPTAILVRNERKMQLVQFVAQLLGPAAAGAIDWDWLLGDTDLGDMATLIDRIKQVVQGQLEAAAQQGALEQANAITQAAQQQADAIHPESPAPAGPDNNTPKRGTSRKVA